MDCPGDMWEHCAGAHVSINLYPDGLASIVQGDPL